MVDREDQRKENQDSEIPDPKEETKLASDSESSSDVVELKRQAYEELVQKSSELAQIQDRFLRSAADFENAKKRLTKEREEFLKFALEDLIRDLLPILDNFERALLHADLRDEKIKSLSEGFRLIQKQLMSILAERGLKRCETIGKSFDPHLHEAVGYVVSENQAEGIVTEEITAGYELNGRLIRPAKVKLSTKKAPSELDGSEKEEELT